MHKPRLDPTFLRTQIEQLRVTCPEAWEGDETLLADMLEGETTFTEFLDAVVFHMLEDKAFAESIGGVLARVKARQDRYQQRSDAMRALAFRVMTAAEVQKAELRQATLSIRAGQPKVIITDEAALPESCVRTKREPDKVAIKDMLERGNPVPGASMSNAEPVLAVRVQ